MSKVSGKPDFIGHYLTIDLTRDILDVSSTGYVIRTSCSDEQASPSRSCALKRIQTMDEEPPDLAKLSHENVVQLLHHWTEEGDLFLVMELMDGDLSMLMEGTRSAGASPISLSVAVDIMLQIAKGMLHLHEMGVSHPHLKCENVLYKLNENKAEAFRVGDVVVKLGGFGCARPADRKSKSWDVLCFGLTCVEILTGDEWCDDISGDMVLDMVGVKSTIPETTPAILRDCIVRCLSTQPTFSDIVTVLQLAKSYVTLTSNDKMIVSESVRTNNAQTMTEELASTYLSNGSVKEIFAVHQLHPQAGDVSTSVRATLIFFHGFHKDPEDWRRTWMTRDNRHVWPQKWLPEDLGAGNIRVLSVSFDANSSVSNKYNRHELGKNLVERLILSPRWKLGEIGEAVFLVGHSFGGVLIKSLVTEARYFVQNNIGQREAMKFEKFLKSLAMCVFYSVPQAATGLEFESYLSECRKIVALQRSSFLQSLGEDTCFIADMNKLSADFESAVSEEMEILAFLEGKPMNKRHILVTEDSCERRSRSWEWHKLDKDNHFEVCRPNSKNHTGYRILLNHLQQHMIASCGVTSSAMDVLDSDVTSVLGKRQADDLFEASEKISWNTAFPGMEKRFSFKEEGSSGSGNFSITPTVSENSRQDSNAIVAAPPAPTIKPSTFPDIESDTQSDQSREQVPAENPEPDSDIVKNEGGIRWRENLGKYLAEYRPPRFKWKLWMGTYTSVDEARRACDCARFYAGQKEGGFYFPDSPALFAELGPLDRPVTLISKVSKDKAFNVELKKRAREIIRKVKNVQIISDNVPSTSNQQLKPLPSDPIESFDPIEIDSQAQLWDESKGSSSQSWSFHASQVDQEH